MTISRLSPKVAATLSGTLGRKTVVGCWNNVRSLILTELEATQNSQSQSALGMLKGNSCLETNFKGEKKSYWSGICERPGRVVEAERCVSRRTGV